MIGQMLTVTSMTKWWLQKVKVVLSFQVKYFILFLVLLLLITLLHTCQLVFIFGRFISSSARFSPLSSCLGSWHRKTRGVGNFSSHNLRIAVSKTGGEAVGDFKRKLGIFACTPGDREIHPTSRRLPEIPGRLAGILLALALIQRILLLQHVHLCVVTAIVRVTITAVQNNS